jgi:hypothetical protein
MGDTRGSRSGTSEGAIGGHQRESQGDTRGSRGHQRESQGDTKGSRRGQKESQGDTKGSRMGTPKGVAWGHQR